VVVVEDEMKKCLGTSSLAVQIPSKSRKYLAKLNEGSSELMGQSRQRSTKGIESR
jgi:hypothetical protein